MSLSIEELLIRDGFPRMVYDVEWEKIPDCEYKDLARQYVDNSRNRISEGRGLFLWGEHGTGKTALACLIGKTIKSQRMLYSVTWVYSRKIAGLIVSGEDFSREASWEDRLHATDLLIIDDLTLKGKDADDFVEDVVRIRCHDRRSTIITSNYSPGKLPSASLQSILGERCFPIHVSGIDWRKKVSENKP